MDENFDPKPEVVYIAPTPWYKRKILWAFLIILLLFPLGLYLYKIYFAGIKKINTDNVSFPCPFAEPKSCISQTPLKLKSGPAIGYKASPKSSVVSSVEITSADYIGVSENKEKNEKYLFESTPSESGCQIISYIFSADATFGNIFSFPIAKGQVLAEISNKEVKVGDDYFNVIIQTRTDPPLAGEANCSLTKKGPEFFNIE